MVMCFEAKGWKAWVYIAIGLSTVLWIIMYLSNQMQGYLAATLVCIGLALFALFDFHNIFFLKAEIANMKRNNDNFKEENSRMQESVRTIEDVNERLSSLTVNFRCNNDKLQANLGVLQKLMAEVEAKSQDMKDHESDAVASCQKWIQTWKEAAASSVRRVLLNASNAVDAQGINNVRGKLDREEYTAFLNCLPDDYREKIERAYPQGFDDIDLEKDGNIDREEFSNLMNTVCNATAM